MNWLAISAVNLAAAVMFGGFGAHALKARLSSEQLGWWHTATEYFFYHALGLLVIGALIRTIPTLELRLPAGLLQIGIIIFCGSLYAMALGAPRWPTRPGPTDRYGRSGGRCRPGSRTAVD